jgi:hypothetical protein
LAMNFRHRHTLGILGVVVIAALAVQADDFWVKKDWKQWSKDDCAKILQDSPWTRRWAKSQVASHQMPGVSGANQEGASAENAPEMHYVVQLRSSLPIREAVVRLQQIQLKYDKMSAAEKKDFDTKAEALLSRDYGDVILVHVDYGSNLQSFEREMSTYWKSIPPEAPPNDLYLINERGERVTPVRFISPQNGSYTFELVFPRLKDKEPVVREGDKTLSIQFMHPAVGLQTQTNTTNPSGPSMDIFGEERVLIQFKLDKMAIAGKPSF